MFRPSCRSSSPFSDLDMWDTRSRFAAQTSAWSGMAAVSGTGFLSKVNTSTCGSTGSFRQNDPGLRKWQSLSHLEPEAGTWPFPPSPGSELRAARGERSFRQAEVGQWMQDAHERLDSQLSGLRNKNSQLSYNKTAAHLHDIKHQEKESAEFSQYEISRQRGQLHDKVIQLEKELLQMRSSMGRGGSDQTEEKTFASFSNIFPLSQEDPNRQDSQRVDSELHKLREALKEAEARAKTQEEERKQALQKLQNSAEIQRTLLNQIEEMNQRLSNTRQSQSEVQEQLSDANNKISQACLDKATLLTQVIKLEDNIKEMKSKQAEDQSEKDALIKEKADLHQRNKVLDLQLKRAQKGSEGCEDSDSNNNNKQDEETDQMREDSKALREVNEKLTHKLEMMNQKLTTSQYELQEMTAERDILSKQTTELKSECSQLVREEDKLLSKMSESGHEELTEIIEKCCQLKESVETLESEKVKLQDQCLRLEAEVLEKEEKLQVQEEEYKRQDALRVQAIEGQKAMTSHWTEKWQKVALTLQATQEELGELKKNNFRNGESDSLLRVQVVVCEPEPERSRDQVQLHGHKGGEAVQTQDAEAVTDLSESSLLREAPSDSQTNQNKTPQVKDEKSSGESIKDTTVCTTDPETDQQRRLVTEQLKSLFKEREEKEVQTVDNSSGGAQTGVPSPQDRFQTAKAMRKAGDRGIWQHGSGLMPVFEEDEESSDCSGGEDGALTKLSTEMFDHTMGAGIINLKAKHEKLLQAALRCKQPVHACLQTAEKLSDTPSDVKVPNMPNYSAESSLQQKRPPPFYPDGIFLAEVIDICSPDEDAEDGVDK
ncbi:putative leucine-rich repeat-containing protein DDB_G0290503 isoform X2 [Notolabrus celidotus]|uniref:putative leucine-rich repeat-containing protein DDB_G0290503 isoform X2 n=1 Tax=Notolabrus celidotus TaxID=1203425 RepID=UPI00148F79E3|nr:putative leucine-rich repeat-containing protein DDB_G0290503 isoform X2 [Notolabrus celidotus]